LALKTLLHQVHKISSLLEQRVDAEKMQISLNVLKKRIPAQGLTTADINSVEVL
jgi:hypothetical protein